MNAPRPVAPAADAPPPVLLPGEYLRLCRLRAGLTLDDLACALETIPRLPAFSLAEWLGQIEAGVAPFQVDVVLALETHPRLLFDRDVLFALIAHAARLTPNAPEVCHGCGGSDWLPCGRGRDRILDARVRIADARPGRERATLCL